MEKDIYDFSEDSDSKTEHGYMLLAGICIILGLIFGILLFINEPVASGKNAGQSIKEYYSLNGTIGDFIAGVAGTLFTLAGFIFVYLTYRDQRVANEKEKIDNRFYTLIQIHVDNANGINYYNPYGQTRA